MSFTSFEESAAGQVRMDNYRWGYRLHARFGADGLGALIRWVQGLFGMAAMIAAVGIWLWPGSSFEADLLAMKGAVTLALVVMSVVWLRRSRDTRAPEIHVDLIRQEVRVMDREHLKQLFRFSDLGAMYVKDHALHLHAPEGHKLAVLDLDPATEARLA
ncbi:MAG: hypothetical protein AAFO93_15285 [Pseudomonadota bacterium]